MMEVLYADEICPLVQRIGWGMGVIGYRMTGRSRIGLDSTVWMGRRN